MSERTADLILGGDRKGKRKAADPDYATPAPEESPQPQEAIKESIADCTAEESKDSEKTGEEEKNHEATPAGFPIFKDPRQARLFELRAKMNAARKKNMEEVQNEYQRRNTNPTSEARKRREYAERAEQLKEELIEAGVDPASLQARSMTAADIEYLEKKKRKKSGVTGWEVFSPEAQYYTYKRRLKGLRADPEEYRRQKAETKHFYRDAEMPVLEQPQLPRQNVDRMVQELEQTIQRRKNWSRRREVNEGADVDYINERNRAFNRKIARAYNPYTAEIKQNLERGTAV
jgi:hypothetical protein